MRGFGNNASRWAMMVTLVLFAGAAHVHPDLRDRAASAPIGPTGFSDGPHDDRHSAEATDLASATSPHSSPESDPRAEPQAPVPTAVDARSEAAAAPEERVAASLDDAPPDEIRRVLEDAIDREQQQRDLFVMPGLVEAAADNGGVRIVFEAPEGLSAAHITSLLEGRGIAAQWDGLRVFPMIDFAAAQVSPQALLHLIESGATSHLELDIVHRPSLAASVPYVDGDDAHLNGNDGDGFAVAILDTGIDTSHPMFAGRVLDEACFSLTADCPNGLTTMFGPGAGVPCAYGCGHGTHVAGIASGSATTGTLDGMAPNASLISIQIFSNVGGSPGAYSSDILAGMQHVLFLTGFYSIASANFSIGGAPFTSEVTCDTTIASQYTAVGVLRAAGVATVAASGNDSLTNAITTPGCLSNTISVGSTDLLDTVSGFSNSAEFLDLLAPGDSIESAADGGGTGLRSGTSMATPHVAGSFATIREAFPTASVDAIESALALSGIPVTDSRNGFTTPRIRVQAAIDLLVTTGGGMPSGGGGGPGAGGGGGATPNAVSQPSDSGGGSQCGLVGIEPFVILGCLHIARRTRRRASAPRSA